MDFRSVVLVGLLSGAALLSATSSCSSADPQTINFSERPRGPGEQASGGPTVPVDGGEAGTTEAGTDGGTSGGPVTAFTGAKAFNPAGAPVGDSINAAGHPAFPGNNPAGQNCMDCHSAAGAAAAKWGVAGTVYTATTGTTAVKGAEVRVVDAKGTELALVYSDAQGNFWSDTIVGGVPGGAAVGVRNATVTKLMATPLTTQDSGCQKTGCHTTGAQGRVYLQ